MQMLLPYFTDALLFASANLKSWLSGCNAGV